MANNNHIFNSFVAGELSPKTLGRTDAGQYNQGCEKVENWIVHPQGGASRRPGTEFLYNVLRADGSTPDQVRIIPFTAANGDRWLLIFTSDPPEISSGVYPWQAYNTATGQIFGIRSDVSSLWTGYYQLGNKGVNLNEMNFAQSGDTMIIVHPLIAPMVIIYMGTGAGPGAGNPAFKMFRYHDANSGNVTSATGYKNVVAKTKTSLISGPLYIVTNLGGNQYQLDAAGSPAVTFDSTWIGKTFRFSAAASTVVVVITQIITQFQMRATYIAGAQTTSPTTYGLAAGNSYEEAAWNEIDGWPRCVTFFEGRVSFYANISFPDHGWFSAIGDIYNLQLRKLEQASDFASAITNADPFDTTLNAELLNKIQWVSPAKTITVGSNQREFIIQGPDPTQSIGPTNIQNNAETPNGGAFTPAARIDNTVVFMQRDRKTIRELVYNLEENSFQASNLNILAEHAADRSTFAGNLDSFAASRGRLVQMVMQQCPNGIMWLTDTQGRLIGMTREREQQVLAWHFHKIAGNSYFTTGGQNLAYQPRVTGLAVMQRLDSSGTGGEPDDLFMVVSRGVKNAAGIYTKRLFIERLGEQWDGPTISTGWVTATFPHKAPIYMDAAVIATSTVYPTGVVTGLPHGVGAVLDVVIDGAYAGQVTVDATGSVSLVTALHGKTTWNAIVGFNFIGDLEPVIPEVPTNTGSSMGRPRHIARVAIGFHRAIGCSYGKISDTNETAYFGLEDIPFKPGVNQDDPIPMYTGEREVTFPPSYEFRPKIRIRSKLPLPCTVVYLVAKMVVYE